MTSVLVLGAGLVARPLVRYLADLGWGVTVGDAAPGKAAELIEGIDGCRALDLSIDEQVLDALVPEHDCAVSLLPAFLHPMVARACIRAGRHMVTASYISDEVRALHDEAKAAGLTLLNEVGLDPGIDHMSAMAIIHQVRDGGGEVVSFRSYCGGLPAPDADDNPLRYKFSWSPIGVLNAAVADARYLRDGDVVEIPGVDLFTHYEVIDVEGVGPFEGYPNRDSVAYREVYELESARTLLRGTLRNSGHCDSWKKMVDLGLFSADPVDTDGHTWASLVRKVFLDGHGGDLPELVAAKLGVSTDDPVIRKLAWLGLFDDDPLPGGPCSPRQLAADRMWERMQFAPGQRDMIVLRHTFEVERPDGKQRIVSTLVDYGIPHGDSAMARTVALPAAIGVRMILEGRVEQTGVVSPVERALYEPILAELAELGIAFEETVTPL